MPQTRVLIADSHPIIGQGLSALLDDIDDISVLATAQTVEATEALILEQQPDVLILDEDLGTNNCARLIDWLAEQQGTPTVVLLSSEESAEPAKQAIELGAFGYVLREASLDDLIAAIRSAHLGDLWLSRSVLATLMDAMQTRRPPMAATPLRQLTRREEQVLELLVAGLDHRGIAEALDLRLNTVRAHTRNIQMKLNVHSNIEAVSVALENGVRPC